jgi:ABC-type uncharacterized transport system auxiliary subunit
VHAAGRTVAADWLLDGDVVTLCCDSGDTAHAVFGLHVAVLEAETKRLRFEKTYESRVPLESEKPAAVVDGWRRAIAEVLTELEQDLTDE